jgi:lysophospholipase L1-like esterase
MSRRELASGIALSAGSVVLTVGLAEAVLRLSGFAPERYPMMGRMANARWTLLLDCYPSNPRGYFEIDLREHESRERYFHVAPLRYDAVAERAPWAVEFRYNAQRFRDAPLGPKPPGVRRVMLLGDSFTEGQGVKEPDTAARVLGRLLEHEAPGRYEVRNCGRRGADFPELLEAFDALLPYEPDLVVYALVLNDAERSEAFNARQTYVDDWILDRGRQVEDLPVPGPLRPRVLDFVQDRFAAWRVGRETTRWYLEMWTEANSDGWARTQHYLREMNRRLRERGAQLLVAPWPLLVGLERDYAFGPVHETIARFCLTAGIAHHDLLPSFQGRRSQELWVHPIDRHPNEAAHRLAAESLVPVVRELLEGR